MVQIQIMFLVSTSFPIVLQQWVLQAGSPSEVSYSSQL